MFAPEVLASSIRPRGFLFKVTEANPAPPELKGLQEYPSDRRFYKAKVEGHQLGGTWAACEVEFNVPVPDQYGVFEIGGMRRIIVHEGFIDLARFRLGKPPTYIFRDPQKILLMALNEIFNATFMEFFMRGQPPTQTDLQSAIDTWFKVSKATQEAPEGIGLRGVQKMVYLRVGREPEMRQFYPKDWGLLDPSSTPQGDQVNLSFRFAKGAEVRGSNGISSWNMFSDVVEDMGIAGKYTPRRTHLLRSNFEHALPLLEYEKPIIGNPGLPGRHLRTAIMHLRAYAGEDAIVISQSAAKKLIAMRRVREQFFAMNDPHLKVAEGDTIGPGDILAEIKDPLTGETTIETASRIRFSSKIEKIRRLRTAVAGYPALRVDFHCCAEIEAETGDKLFTRGAIKGVANVVQDDHMPIMPDGRYIEAIISPESVVGRRAMSVYWEMMATAYVLKTGNKVDASHLTPSPTFTELVEMGYGDPIRLELDGEELPESTFCGYQFFLRVDKLARENVSAHGDRVVLNGMRLPVDSAKMSGQKRDMAKGFAFLARGMPANFLHSLRSNMHSPHALRELTKVLTVEERE